MPFGPGYCGEPLDGPVLEIFARDAVSLPLVWWLVQPVLGPDGVTVVAPGVPVAMAGMRPGGEFLSYGQVPGQGVAMAVTGSDPASARWTLSAPGFGQPGDVTSRLVPGPAMRDGPRVRVHYDDAAGRHTLGTFYLRVR